MDLASGWQTPAILAASGGLAREAHVGRMPVDVQPELERFDSCRWLQRRWLLPVNARGLTGAMADATWVTAFALGDGASVPSDSLVATAPFYLGYKPQTRATDRQFDAAAWPSMLRLFQQLGDRDEFLLRAVGPRDVLANRNRNRFFRAAYGVMCANGLHRYAIRGRNHGFETDFPDSGVPAALPEPMESNRA